MRIITFFSHLRGSGKTIACANIAVALAHLGQRVLMVDLDGRAGMSNLFGINARFEESVGMAILAERPLLAITRTTAVARVWLAPAAPELARLSEMGGSPDKDRTQPNGRLGQGALWLELCGLANAFDFILLDCPADSEFMSAQALIASHEVLAPVSTSIINLDVTNPSIQFIWRAQQCWPDARPVFIGFLPIHTQRRGNWRAMRPQADQDDMPHFTPIPFWPACRANQHAPTLKQRLVVLAEPLHPTAVAYLQVAHEIRDGLTRARAFAVLLKQAPTSYTPQSYRLPRRR